MAFYDLFDKDMEGKEVYEEYHSRGFKVLAFPCNQFGAQEPGSNEEIIKFVKGFDEKMPEKLTFFEKADVNGASTREVYSFLKANAPNTDGTLDVTWNFEKFLVDSTGASFKRYSPKTEPFTIKADIEEFLKAKES